MFNTIAPILLIVASIWLFFGYTNPNYTDITASVTRADRSVAELKTEREEYEQALNTVSEIEVVRETLLTKFNSLKEEDKDKIVKLLPDNIDSVRLIIEINNIASQYGMSLSDISLSQDEKKTGTKAPAPAPVPPSPDQAEIGVNTIGPSGEQHSFVSLGFTVSGPYDHFLQFIDKIQKSLRVVDIDSLSFTTAPGTSAATSADSSGKAVTPDYYEYNVSIKTYYLK